MLKVFFKLSVLTLVLVGIGLVLPGDKAAAASCGPYSAWGVNTGEHNGSFAGLIVRAEASNGQPLNGVRYNLRSALPGPRSAYDIPPQVENHHARIFDYPIGGGRSDSKWFNIGSNIYNGRGTSNPGSYYNCDGWSVIGPGYPQHQGNNRVLDCNEERKDGGNDATLFWISDITRPNGYPQGGRWQVQVKYQATGWNWQSRTPNIDQQGMGTISLDNGTTAWVKLIWHPNNDQPTPPEAECNLIRFLIPNDHQDGQGGASNHSDYAVYVNDWGTPGHPKAAGSPDYQEEQVYGSPPGPWVDYAGSTVEPQFGGQHVEKNIRVDNKAVTGTLRYTLVIYDRFTNSNGNHVIKVRHRSTHEINNCWQASCSIQINSTIPGRSNNAVRAGEQFTGRVRITNTGVNNLPSAMITNAGNFQLSATTNWFGGLRPLPLTHNLPYYGSSGDIYLADFNFVAPNSPGSYTLSMYPDYWGRAGIGPSCPVTINVYKQFSLNLTASTSMQPDNEDPSVVQHRGTIGPNNPHVVVPYSARSTLNGSIIHSVNASGGTDINYSYDHTSFPNLKAGDTYCTSISTPNGSGWVGPGNDLVDADDPRSSNTACATVHDRPYLRVYGADVAAWNLCSPGDIRAYISSRSGKTGSGGQLGVFSIGGIDGFISASLRYTLANPKPPKGLTFGNLSGTYGGNFGAGECPPDYFASRDGSAESFNGNLGGTMRTRSGKFNANNTSGPTTISNGLNLTGKKTIYVEGDAYITGTGITYANTGNYGSVEDIPRFTLIASGNIYIAPGVITLDGTYVAGGKISTCATASGSHNTSQLWGACRGSRLVINGAFIAPEVEFLRSRGSLRSSSQSNDAATRTNAAEVFIYSPEVYLAQMLGESTGPSAGSQIYQPRSYDAITTLPPIL